MDKTETLWTHPEKDINTGIIPSQIPGKCGVSPTQMTAKGLKHTIPLEKVLGKKEFGWDEIPGELKGVFDLHTDVIWQTENTLGIPELLPEMILSEFPKPLKTWGSRLDTPDDGKSYYFCSFGSTVKQFFPPLRRVILCYFTGDSHIDHFEKYVRYEVGKMLTAEVIACVVPDVSFWEGNPKVIHMHAAYRAQWLGRYLQEAGIKVIPRFEYFLPEVQDFSLIGVPKGTPTLATQLHTAINKNTVPRIKESLIKGLKLIRPGQFLVYSSEKGREILSEIKGDLACDELIVLPTAKEVRRPKKSWKETDPHLLELRKRKKKNEDRG